MAANGLNIDQETFCCSVCLDLLKDPVTIPCGHSYCMSCVNTHWDGEVGKQSYSCPQCRQNFTQRPVLVKNTMLAVLMEGLKKSGPAAAPLPPSAAPGEVFCDLCSGREVKAVKSCLQCQVSYCKEHLQPHYDVAALKKHKLVEPTENLQENMCSRHDEVMKMFCRTDQQCICYLCSVDQHKGHHTVTAAAERAEKQRELQAFQQNILQKIKLKEEDVRSLQQQVKNNSLSADAAVKLCDRSLKDLLHLLEKRMREVRQQVRSQQEAEEHRINELQDTVQQELTELRRKHTEVDTLSHTEDHVTFLHKFASLSKIRETSESVKSSQAPAPFRDMVTAAVSKLRSTLEEIILFDPSTVVHKPKVNTAKTDALPAEVQKLTLSTQGAPSPPLQTPGKPPAVAHKTKMNAPKAYAPPPGPQATAPPQQSSQREGCTATFSIQPPAPQTSAETSPMDFAAVVHKLKANYPSDHPEGVYVSRPPEGSSFQEVWDHEETLPWEIRRCLSPWHYSKPPPPLPLESKEEFPALPRHNLKLKTPAPSPRPVQPVTSESNYQRMKQYAWRITWDPRSLNAKLEMSQWKLSVKHTAYSSNYRPHAFRFTALPQAVSKETLTGQRYFEVLLSNHWGSPITVAVAYKDMRRDGPSNECKFGMNAKSWALECFEDRSVFWHNGDKVEFPICGNYVGVFVDYQAGLLSFYRQHCELVHTVKTTFTHPLVAGVRLDHVGNAATISHRMFVNARDDDDD